MCGVVAAPELKPLDGAVDALASLDPAELDGGDAAELLVELRRATAKLAAVEARLVAAVHRDRPWAEEGYRSTANWLAASDNTSMADAHATVRLARRLRSMPATAAALAAGATSRGPTPSAWRRWPAQQRPRRLPLPPPPAGATTAASGPDETTPVLAGDPGGADRTGRAAPPSHRRPRPPRPRLVHGLSAGPQITSRAPRPGPLGAGARGRGRWRRGRAPARGPAVCTRWPTAATPRTTAAASATPRRSRCGRACRSRPTTRPPTAWRSARPAR